MTSQARSLLLILIAVIIAGFTAYAVKSRTVATQEAAQPAAPVVTKILLAKADIPVGGFVQADRDLVFADFPASSVQPFHLREGAAQAADYNGAVARRAIKTGEPITGDLLIKPGSGGFLAAVLEPGSRAVSVAVTATSGNAGFIFPGDRVDLLLTHKVTVDTGEDSVISETFMRDVRVVAVDQLLDNPENKAIMAKTVTLEVTPAQAEKINVAAEIGKITVVLRSLGKGKEEPAEFGMTSDREMSPSLNRRGEMAPSVRVIRGDAMQKMQFYKEPENARQ